MKAVRNVEPLIAEVIHQSDFFSKEISTRQFVNISLVFAVLMGWAYCIHRAGSHDQIIHKPEISMASHPIRSAKAFAQPTGDWQHARFPQFTRVRVGTLSGLVSGVLFRSGKDQFRQIVISKAEAETPKSDGPAVWKAGQADVFSEQARTATQILHKNPGEFDSNIDQALKELQEQRGVETSQKLEQEGPTDESTEVLRRKIDEVQQKDRARVVMELLYLKVCRKFRDNQVLLVPPMETEVKGEKKGEKGESDIGAIGEIGLTGLTLDLSMGDALDLTKENLLKIIAFSASTTPDWAMVKLSLFEAGQIYALSSVFGYYLRSTDAKIELEKLANSLGGWKEPGPIEEVSYLPADHLQSLTDYISDFEEYEVQQVLSTASVEAQMVMELNVCALFGNPKVVKDKLFTTAREAASDPESPSSIERAMMGLVMRDKVETVKLTSIDLLRVVLEGMIYGTLVKDAEKDVGRVYELTKLPCSSL